MATFDVKPPEGITYFPDGNILIENVRIGYTALAAPQAFNNEDKPDAKKKYQAALMLESAVEREAKIRDWLLALCQHTASESKLGRLAPDRFCLRDGSYGNDDSMQGFWLFNAAEETRPGILNSMAEPLADGGAILDGDYVNAVVALWPQDNSYGKRVNANLRGVQQLSRGPVRKWIKGGGGAAQAQKAASLFKPVQKTASVDDMLG